MARNTSREMTLEEFDAWCAANQKFEAVSEAADEQGGPRLSLVPVPTQAVARPTDSLPPIPPRNGRSGLKGSAGSREPVECPLREGDRAEHGGGADAGSHVAAMPFDGIALEDSRKRLAGWSAERQRLFLSTLAETGSVHLAASAARLAARSAYRLRARSPSFARAWDVAQQLSVGRLSAIAFDRAINGRLEQIYRDGELVGERRVPNDRLLTWLLARLDPRRFAMPWEQRGDADPQAHAIAVFPALLEALTDAVAE
jgi:hypothetical protein